MTLDVRYAGPGHIHRAKGMLWLIIGPNCFSYKIACNAGMLQVSQDLSCRRTLLYKMLSWNTSVFLAMKRKIFKHRLPVSFRS